MKHKDQANKRQGFQDREASPEMQGWHLTRQPKAVMEAKGCLHHSQVIRSEVEQEMISMEQTCQQGMFHGSRPCQLEKGTSVLNSCQAHITFLPGLTKSSQAFLVPQGMD